jgi:hypothetical protein
LDWRYGHKEGCALLRQKFDVAQNLELLTRKRLKSEAEEFEFRPPRVLTEIHTNPYILCKLMRLFPSEAQIVEMSCVSLCLMGKVMPLEQRYIQAKRAGSSGVISQLVEAMGKFSANLTLQCRAFEALSSLVARCRFNIDKLLAAGGVSRVLDAMLRFDTSIRLQSHGMLLLSSACGEDTTELSDSALRRLVQITAALLVRHSTHPTDPHVSDPMDWRSRRALLRGLKTTQFLVQNTFHFEENITRLGEAGALLAVVRVMNSHREDPEIMVIGWDLLVLLTELNPANCHLMFSSTAALPYAACLLWLSYREYLNGPSQKN